MCYLQNLSDNHTSDSDLPDPPYNASLPPQKKWQRRLLSSKIVITELHLQVLKS